MLQSLAQALKFRCGDLRHLFTGNRNSALMGGIFISYRRDDAAADAGRLRDDLQRRCPLSRVFLDVAIRAGADFRAALAAELDACEVLIALIGPRWLQARNNATGQRRLDEEVDYVRLEIETALAKHKLVIPVLLPGTRMPKSEELPPSIRELAWRNAVEFRYDRWSADIDYLAEQLPNELGCTRETETTSPPKRFGYVISACAALLVALHIFAIYSLSIDPNYVAAGASFALGLSVSTQLRHSKWERFTIALAVAILAGILASILVAILSGENIIPRDLVELRLFIIFVAIIFMSYLVGMHTTDLFRGRRKSQAGD